MQIRRQEWKERRKQTESKESAAYELETSTLPLTMVIPCFMFFLIHSTDRNAQRLRAGIPETAQLCQDISLLCSDLQVI